MFSPSSARPIPPETPAFASPRTTARSGATRDASLTMPIHSSNSRGLSQVVRDSTANPACLTSIVSSEPGSIRTWEGSRRISIAFCSSDSAATSDEMTSAITKRPPGRSTRKISDITRSGRSKWCTESRVTTASKEASAKGSSAALPSRKVTLPTPAAAQRCSAFFSICGVRSNATTSRADLAIAALRMPGPQATSSTDPCPASPSAVTKRSVNAASVIAADTENVSACRVNSSRTRFSCFSMVVSSFRAFRRKPINFSAPHRSASAAPVESALAASASASCRPQTYRPSGR